ncbi:MAG: hypothetical protein M3Z25_11005 [Actinomycetota bacterium]|nr:hypothetical protein [Actinomycetota bacterium]
MARTPLSVDVTLGEIRESVMSTVAVQTLATAAPDGGTSFVGVLLVLVLALVFAVGSAAAALSRTVAALLAAVVVPLLAIGRLLGLLLVAATVVAAMVFGGTSSTEPVHASPSGPEPAATSSSTDGSPPGATESAAPATIDLPIGMHLVLLGVVFVIGFAVGGTVEKRTLRAQWRTLARRRRWLNEEVRHLRAANAEHRDHEEWDSEAVHPDRVIDVRPPASAEPTVVLDAQVPEPRSSITPASETPAGPRPAPTGPKRPKRRAARRRRPGRRGRGSRPTPNRPV